jgi:hypothetical protein
MLEVTATATVQGKLAPVVGATEAPVSEIVFVPGFAVTVAVLPHPLIVVPD